MPIIISRKVSMPLRHASAHTSSEVTMPPAIAASVMVVRFWPKKTIATSTPLHAPVLKPITSGLPSGLRINDWKMAPLTPSAAPISSAIITRGRRHSVTTMAIARGASPNRAANTCESSSVTAPLRRLNNVSNVQAMSSSRQLAIRRRDGDVIGHLRLPYGEQGKSAPAHR